MESRMLIFLYLLRSNQLIHKFTEDGLVVMAFYAASHERDGVHSASRHDVVSNLRFLRDICQKEVINQIIQSNSILL